MKFFIQTFGCQMNLSDSERMASFFEKSGFKKTNLMREADFFIVNMCSVRQSAVDRVFGLNQIFPELKKDNPNLKLILTGCILPSDKPRFEKIFDFILDVRNLQNWKSIILGKKTRPGKTDYFSIPPLYGNNFSVSIPISKGCDNYCAYCAVPYTRGRLVSRKHTDILAEVKTAVKNGAKEIWLLGQNVNNYGYIAEKNKKIEFSDLIRMVNKIEGDFWIRFTSPHPKDFNDKAVEAIASSLKVTPYLNLPVQSGDDEILKKMRRPYTAESYLKLTAKIRNAFKKYRQGLEAQVAISTDVIVGFPGETKKHFRNTISLFKKCRFDMAYIARYSPRPDTQAFKMKDSILTKEKKNREAILTEIVKKTALKNNQVYLGKNTLVLVEKIKEEKGKIFCFGKNRNYKTVKFSAGKASIKPGDIIEVKITKVQAFGLTGKISK